jgi:hypothetical protein
MTDTNPQAAERTDYAGLIADLKKVPLRYGYCAWPAADAIAKLVVANEQLEKDVLGAKITAAIEHRALLAAEAEVKALRELVLAVNTPPCCLGITNMACEARYPLGSHEPQQCCIVRQAKALARAAQDQGEGNG